MAGDARRTVLVTGVSPPAGHRLRDRAAAAARRRAGVRAFLEPLHAGEPWGADPAGIDGVLDALGGDAASLAHAEIDLEDADAAHRLVTTAVRRFGAIDAMVVNHARSSEGELHEITAAELDRTWAVNVRATLLLVGAFSAQCPPDGRVVLFTSGQHLAPMSREIPFAATKGTLHQLTLTLSDALVDAGITVNCVNPGPTDTGWATEELTETVGRALPRGRWNSPDEPPASWRCCSARTPRRSPGR